MTSLFRACWASVCAFALVGLVATTAQAQVLSQKSVPQSKVQPPPDRQQPPPTQPPPGIQGDAIEEPQEPPAEPPPGFIVSVEGSAVLERDNTTGDAITGMPLLVGDRLRSEGGRLEVKWAERSELKLARYTELDILSRAMVRVPRGRVTITVVTPPGQSVSDQIAVDAPGASVRFYAAGEYQIAVGGNETPEVELLVIRGSAQLASDRGQTMLADGERAMVRDGSLPSAGQAFDVASLPAEERVESDYDPTEDLAAFQRSSAGGAYHGTSYLPTELYGYETVLNSNGSWENDPSYGYVWYPRVAADWRPYYRGRWHHVPRYGWTWLGAERWAYPTHHYGRWGFSSRGRWFWRPSRTWGAAWVSWAVAPSYVGWCPLGWDGSPVFGFYNFSTTVHLSRGYEPWRGWTVIPSQRFGYRYDVPRHRVDHNVLQRERPAFITAWSAPRHPGRGTVITRTDVRGNLTTGAAPPATTYPRHYPGQRVEGSRAVPPGPGYSGYYPGGYNNRATEREESPYDRARRVMDRRGSGDGRDDNNRDGRDGRDDRQNDAAGAGGVRTPNVRGNGAVPGYGYDANSPRGAYPRSGVTRQPQRDDRDDNRSRRANDNDNDNGGATRVPSGDSPYRHAPGMSRPPSGDDSPGMSRRRSSSDDGGSGGGRPSARPDSGNRNDDGGGRPSGGYAVPRNGGDGGGDRGDRGGRSSDGGGRSAGSSDRGDRGGGDRGGRGDGGGSSRGNDGGSNAGSSGAPRRHPR